MTTLPDNPGKTKTTFQLWKPLAVALERNLRLMHIKRDSYLNELLTGEIEELATEVTFRNSDKAYDRLNTSLKSLGERTKVNLVIDETLLERMKVVLNEKNIPRDCFLNRVVYFLVAKNQRFSKKRYEPNKDHDLFDTVEDEKNDLFWSNRFAAAKDLLANPFFHIRMLNDGNFYTTTFFGYDDSGDSPNLYGLNVAISKEEDDDFNDDGTYFI